MRQLKQTRFSSRAKIGKFKFVFRTQKTSPQVGKCHPAPGGAPRRCPRRFGEDPARIGPERPKSRPERPKSGFMRIRRHRRDPLQVLAAGPRTSPRVSRPSDPARPRPKRPPPGSWTPTPPPFSPPSPPSSLCRRPKCARRQRPAANVAAAGPSARRHRPGPRRRGPRAAGPKTRPRAPRPSDPSRCWLPKSSCPFCQWRPPSRRVQDRAQERRDHSDLGQSSTGAQAPAARILDAIVAAVAAVAAVVPMPPAQAPAANDPPPTPPPPAQAPAKCVNFKPKSL